MAKKQCVAGKTWDNRFPGFPSEIQEKIGFVMKQNIRTRTARIREVRLACNEVKIAIDATEEMRNTAVSTRRAAMRLNVPPGLDRHNKHSKNYPLGLVYYIFVKHLHPHKIAWKIHCIDQELSHKWKVNKCSDSRRYELNDEWSNMRR